MSAQQLKLQADKIERQVADMRFRQKLLGVSELLVKYFFNAGIIENVAIFEFSAVELLKIDGVSKADIRKLRRVTKKQLLPTYFRRTPGDDKILEAGEGEDDDEDDGDDELIKIEEAEEAAAEEKVPLTRWEKLVELFAEDIEIWDELFDEEQWESMFDFVSELPSNDQFLIDHSLRNSGEITMWMLDGDLAYNDFDAPRVKPKVDRKQSARNRLARRD